MTQLEQGMIEADEDEVMVATERGRAYYRELFTLHDAVAAQLWQHRSVSLPVLATLVDRLLKTATASGGPALRTASPPYEPTSAGPALLLFNRPAALRHHRADAHAAAWTAAGLTDGEAPGQGAQRDRIEAETNRLDAPPYDALDEAERLHLLAGLAALPG